MKKIVCLLASMIILALLAACGSSDAMDGPVTNGLMENASPGTSALIFYCYDGDVVRQMTMYQSGGEKQDILDKLDAVKIEKAKSWSFKKITFPIYGLLIGSKVGVQVQVAWSNGYWFAQDGTIYKFDFDFSSLETDYDWSNLYEYSSFAGFPCARWLTQQGNKWNKSLLMGAFGLSAPDGVTMEIMSHNGYELTVHVTNQSGQRWEYGEVYCIQLLLDGIWYDIPVTPRNWDFILPLYTLHDGETVSKTYNIEMYGDLPNGTYRIIVDDVWAAFKVKSPFSKKSS